MLNSSDTQGGAARAAYRLHHALVKFKQDSWLAVDHKNSDDWRVISPQNRLPRLLTGVRPYIGAGIKKILRSDSSYYYSLSLIPSAWPKRLKHISPDITHLHWVCDEMLSVADIGRLSGPVVWTLHDMWAFCGSEHHTDDFRWKDGYRRRKSLKKHLMSDVDRWIWNRKFRHWKRPLQIVAPSCWLAQCVRESALMQDWPVRVIPNAIDTDVWAPVDKSLARSLLGLPCGVPLVLFGAVGGRRDPIKGFDLLLPALNLLAGEKKGLHLAILGESTPRDSLSVSQSIHYLGHLHDDVSLRLVYSAADALIISSRRENLPNTGLEALACGTPVVAFDTCGLSDIVDHKKTGYLAKAFDIEDLATGISWVLDRCGEYNLSENARKKAVSTYSYPLIASQYVELYRSTIHHSL